MFPSTLLVFTKSFRLNFSTSGSSSNSGIDDGGHQRESGRTTSDYCSWYDQPHWHIRGGKLQVLFCLNFYPGKGGELITLTFILFTLWPMDFCLDHDRCCFMCRCRCRFGCRCCFRCRCCIWSCLCC